MHPPVRLQSRPREHPSQRRAADAAAGNGTPS